MPVGAWAQVVSFFSLALVEMKLSEVEKKRAQDLTDFKFSKFAATLALAAVVVAIIVMMSYCCAKLASYRGVRELELTVPVSSLNMVPDLKVDELTMDKLLQDMATENPVVFTVEQLESFTNNYSTQLGSGVVYRGQLSNEVKIAVKILNTSMNKRVEAQFMAEVGTPGRTHHKNLVKLYGFCNDQTMAARVVGYMENGTLDKYMFRETEVIKCEKLHGIAIETAKGIAYLHEECQQRIIHCDIKPAT